MLALSQDMLDPGFGRVALAKRLVELSAVHAAAIADLGHVPGSGIVTRSLVVHGQVPTTMSTVLWRLAHGPLPDFSRPDPRTLHSLCPSSMQESVARDISASVVGPELRLLVGDDDRIHTYVGLFGKPGVQRFSRQWRYLLNELLPAMQPLLTRTRVPFMAINGSLAVDLRGKLLAADAAVEPWFANADRVRSLSALVRCAQDTTVICGPIDGGRVHLRTARGIFGVGWMGQLLAPEPLDRASDAQLTPTQRAVAGYAAVGATSAEIAQTLGVQVETVRTHIRDIYHRLGISTRAELARRWASEGYDTQRAA
ncbi:MAG: helix-turn-helix transcriptional regulator [Myxococcales bacterium]|nr:helix-turn-helix transcriptional regulator [Myxococcales bacterium]